MDSNSDYNIDFDACDESKCVARGRVDLDPDQPFLYDRFDQEDVVTCYGDAKGDFFPKMCADGFVPFTIEEEPTVNVTGATKNCINQLWRAYILHNFTDLPLEYFTCCPPPKSKEAQETLDTAIHNNETEAVHATTTLGPSRHCSDPVFAPKGWKEDDENADQVVAALCQAEGMGERKYPRRTKKFWNTASFVCCDTLEPIAGSSTSNNEELNDEELEEQGVEETTIGWIETQTSHLDDVDCIPYSNRFYDRGFLDRNRVGRTWINKRLCDFPGGDARFQHPRLLDGVLEDVPGADMTRRFQCCQTSSVPVLEPYVQDSRFYIECYTWLVLFVTAGLASAIIAIALSLPVIVQRITSDKKNKMDRSTKPAPVFASSTLANKSSVLGNKSSTLNYTHRTAAATTTRRQISYSPYNLYLVYLAIPDLIVSLTFVFGVCARMITQQPVNHNLIGTIVLVYGLANCLLNAMVCRQVWVLLRKSHQRQRVKPPTLTRVTIEAIVVFGISILMFLWVYLPLVASQRAYNNSEYDKAATLETLSTVTTSITGVMIVLPIAYVVWISYSIWRHKYIPPISNRMSVTNKANRALAIYFFRIVAVFLIVWIIGAFIGGLATAFTIMDGNNWPMYVFFTLVAIQQIATTGVILMSPVSRQYVKALFSLSYCFPNRKDRRGHRHPHRSGSSSSDHFRKHSHLHSGEQSTTQVANPTLTSHCSATESPPEEAGGGTTTDYTVSMDTYEKGVSKNSVDLWISREISREMRISDDSCDSFGDLEDGGDGDGDADLFDADELPAVLRAAAESSESSDDIRASISVLQQFSSTREIRDLFHSSIRRNSNNTNNNGGGGSGMMQRGSIPEQSSSDRTQPTANNTNGGNHQSSQDDEDVEETISLKQ